MKLHHCRDARSFRVLWTLEEIGAPYDLQVWPFPPRALAKDFLAINPLGTVPALEIDGTVVTESAGACELLAERFPEAGLHVPPGDPDRAAYLNWLHRADATLTFPQTIVLRYRVFEPPERRLPQAADDYAAWFLARLRSVETALEDGRPHLLGERFTAADIAVQYALDLGATLGLDARYKPHCARYLHALRERPGHVRAKARQSA